jgi:proteasome accessory factor A
MATMTTAPSLRRALRRVFAASAQAECTAAAHWRDRVPVHSPPVDRRIFGLENEYGVTCTLRGQRRLSPDEVARYLFRRVVSWGRSSNVFLENGARLYLDVGSHPEYATPECDSIRDLVIHDKAGERILEGLVQSAEQRLREEGIRGEVFLFKNNTDSAGNSYGCHENYLVEREGDFSKFTDVLIPFLVTRQIYAGAGKVLQTARGAMFCIAQRAEHIWEGVSSATTRSRPIINTRDEPHADAERFRRLHVIVGDSNMSEYATFLKVGATAIILRMLEDDPAPWRDLTLENPIRAIREISHDITCRRRVRLANGRELSAVEIQSEYLNRALRFAKRRGLPPLEQRALEMWEHVMTHLEDDPLKLRTEVDWVIKHHMIEAYRKRGDLPLTHPRVSLLDLAYHDVTRSRSLYYLLERRGQVDRMVEDDEINEAMNIPPQTTRARLRGAFIKRAKERKRDYTVDWVHLKLNDQAQRTVLCKDPFKSRDERVERLIASL